MLSMLLVWVFLPLAQSSDLTMADSKMGKRFRGAQALSEVTKLVQSRTPVHSPQSLKPSLSPMG